MKPSLPDPAAQPQARSASPERQPLNSALMFRLPGWRQIMKAVFASLLAALAFAAPAPAQIVLSQIHCHPVEEPAFNTDGTPLLSLTNGVHEFVEIQNTSAAAVNLEGWTLAGATNSPTLPSSWTNPINPPTRYYRVRAEP
jgi:hypothetical protein